MDTDDSLKIERRTARYSEQPTTLTLQHVTVRAKTAALAATVDAAIQSVMIPFGPGLEDEQDDDDI